MRHNENISHTLEDFGTISLSDSETSTQQENVEIEVIAHEFDQSEVMHHEGGYTHSIRD